jgi:hypothetical protein
MRKPFRSLRRVLRASSILCRNAQLPQQLSRRIPLDSRFLKVVIISPKREAHVKRKSENINVGRIALRY